MRRAGMLKASRFVHVSKIFTLVNSYFVMKPVQLIENGERKQLQSEIKGL